MITDTAFFRNKNYHRETDSIDTLNFNSMTEIVKGLYNAFKKFLVYFLVLLGAVNLFDYLVFVFMTFQDGSDL